MNTNNAISYNKGSGVLRVIIVTVIVALVAAGVVYVFLKRQKISQEKPLTESEKLAILEQLAKESKPQPSVVERSRILEALRAESQRNK